MNRNSQEERRLVAAAAKGDRKAFAALVEAYYMLIYRIACKWCGNPQDAQDIAQEVCIKLGQAIGGYRGEAAFSSWLYRITLNAVRDFQRGQGRQAIALPEALENQEDDCPDPEQQAIARQLWQSVQRLPSHYRDAVLLVYAEGFSHREAAAVLDCSEGTVSWYIHEAKKKLQDLTDGR